MKYSFSRWWFWCWSSESVVSHGEAVHDCGGCSMCHVGRLYVIVGEVLWGGQQEYGKPMFYPSISVNLKMLWKECSLKRKKRKPRKKKSSDTFHAHELSHLMLDGFTCESLSSQLNLFWKSLSLYNWKPQATWSDPQCSVSTFVLTSLAMIPGACSCIGNGFHFPRYFFMSAGATESRWILLVICKLLEDPAVI